jgi:hypothetical protein
MSNLREDNKLEKFYTPHDFIQFVLDESKKYIDFDEVESFLEPASGSGNMIDVLEQYNKEIEAYDISNETGREDIRETDFLKLPISYRKGRYTLSNPPFHKGIKFLWKCLEISDYCCFILSASSIANIDWNKVQEKFEVNKIQIKKKQEFTDTKQDVAILYLKRK